MLTPNPQPNLILNRKISVWTSFNGSSIDEPHKVIGPMAQNLNVAHITGTNKMVIPLSENLGEGGHYLKIHKPTTLQVSSMGDSTLYVTFCKKNSNYVDGYQDYNTNLPQAYIESLKLWIDNGQSPLIMGATRTRRLSFTAYGRETNQPENSIILNIDFTYGGISSVDPQEEDISISAGDGGVGSGTSPAQQNINVTGG